MKLIRAIFRHSVLLAIVIGAGVAYYYREDWLPKFYDKVAELRELSGDSLPGEKAADEAVAPDAATIVEAPAVVPEPVAQAAEAASEPSSEVEEASVAPPAEPVPPVAQAPVPASRVAPDLSRYRPLEESEVGSESVPESAPAAGESTSAATESGPVDLAKAGAPAPEVQTRVPVTAADTDTHPVWPPPDTGASAPDAQASALSSSDAREQLRADARTAFWQHNYQQAESDYKALAELDPADPDAFGELGNVYFSQGKWDQAADAFYEAGVRLVKRGENRRANDLLVIIRGLNPEKAQQLQKLLTEVQEGTDN